MGVKDLWNIISPSSERRPIYELQGKVIAIDLSGWIVDSQSVTDNVVQPKMYLRNLFFRTAFLLMNEISPVFVLEGTAPSLKHKTIAKRNEIRNGPGEKKTNRKGGRSNFNRILKECEEMLKYMGISCIRGQGEAEAMCALLNAEGLVDGCISQDSDCFLYGAKVVYRNFCTSSQGNRGTSGGSIDEYSIEKIERVFGLGRNKMIALALLCGCDYDDGLNGVGKEAALKLFKVVSENKILERMKSWRTDSMFARMEAELANPNICTTCGHQGKMRAHVKSGCKDCGTLTKCNDDYKEKRALISNELSMRKKALLVEDFPSEELINEFISCKDPVPSNLNLQWNQPQVLKFVSFMERCVIWETEYAYAKILPLLTRWQVRHLAEIPDDRRLKIPNLLIPEKIKKPRNIKGVATFEIIWQDEEGLFKGMTLSCISDKENDSEEPPVLNTELATLEPQYLFEKCYPLLVEEFNNAKLAKKKKPAKPRGKKAKPTEEGEEKVGEKKKAQRRPRKPKTLDTIKNRKIDEFIQMNTKTLEESFDALTITPKRKKKSDDVIENEIKLISSNSENIDGFQLKKVKEIERFDHILNGSLLAMFNELTPEDFPSEAEDENMSEIVQDICSRSYSTNTYLQKEQITDNMNNFESHSPINNVKSSDIVIKPTISLKNRKGYLQKPINSAPNADKSITESGNLDCTLKRILDSHKNNVDCVKKPSSLIKSPNIFAKSKKSNRKFDLVNFTLEHGNSPEKISEDCIRRSINISSFLASKDSDQDDSIEKIDRINASLERFLFEKKLSKDSKVPEFLARMKIQFDHKSQNETKVTDDSQLTTPNVKYSSKKRNRGNFSLERSLHVQNLMKDFKKSDSCFKSDKQYCIEEVEVLNSSLEHVRVAQSMNIDDNQDIQEPDKVFLSNISESIDPMELVNSSFELLEIVEKPEEKNYETNEIKEKTIETDVQLLDCLGKIEESKNSVNNQNKRIIPDEIEFSDESDMFDFSNESVQTLQSPEVNCFRVEENIGKLSAIFDKKHNIRESINIEMKNESSRSEIFESINILDNEKINTRESINIFDNKKIKPRESANIFNTKKIPDHDESIDEFDLLISRYKPLDERLEEKIEIVRTSTPDFFVKSNKKLSFGIDDLFNDTD